MSWSERKGRQQLATYNALKLARKNTVEAERPSTAFDGRAWLADQIGCEKRELRIRANEPWHDGRHVRFEHPNGPVDVYQTGTRGYAVGIERQCRVSAVWHGGDATIDVDAVREIRW